MALRSIVRLSSLILLALAPPALAQNSQTPLVPGLERFDLNGERPRVVVPPVIRSTLPPPVPTVRATPVARATPAPRATTVPRVAEPARKPEPSDVTTARTPPATPLISDAAIASPPAVGAPDPASTGAPPAPIEIGPDQPLARPAATRSVIDTAAAAGNPGTGIPGTGISPGTIVLGMLVLAGMGLAGYFAWMRRRQLPEENFEIEMNDLGGEPDAGESDPIATLRSTAPRGDPARATPTRPADLPDLSDLPPADAFPPAPPQPAAPAPSPTPFFIRDTAPAHGPRASLELTVRPQRAGTNLTSAAVDYEIDIANNGEADAIGIRLDLRLLSASADQDAILTALYAAPIDKPVVAPFEIPAGGQVSLGGMALLPREALSIMTVQDRDFFVPLLSLNLVYGWGGAARGQTASAHVIGIERPDDAKMAPFRLDTGPRMYDRVGQRMHTLTVTR